jgi:uncharacterized RDD family membrane protein YckC
MTDGGNNRRRDQSQHGGGQQRRGQSQPQQGRGQQRQGQGQPQQGGRQPRQGQPQQGRGQPQQGRGQPQQGRGQGGHGFAGGNWDGNGYPRPPDRRDSDVVGSRILAQIIDSIIVTVLFFGFILVLGGAGTAAGGESGAGIFGIGALAGFLGVIFYFLLLEGFWDGYTLGKKVVGIKVVKEDGAACTPGASLVRNLLRIIDGLFYYVVGFILMAMSDKRQRLGDRLASTVVVTDTPD